MDEITKIIKKFKEILKGVAAMFIVALGVGFMLFYLKEIPSIGSVLIGLIGLAILSPAVEYYHQLIKDFFK
jgi:hypothetical protein